MFPCMPVSVTREHSFSAHLLLVYYNIDMNCIIVMNCLYYSHLLKSPEI